MKTLLPLLVLLMACGGASDDTDAKPTSSSSALSCDVTAGEDVCARPFDAVTRETLELAASFALLAADQRRDLEEGCRSGLVDLGAPAGPDVIRPCDSLVTAMGEGASRLTVKTVDPACETVAPPSCAAQDTVRRRCTGGELAATAPDDATDWERRVATMIRVRLGGVVRTKHTLESMSEISGKFAGNVSAVANIAEECRAPVTRLAGDGVRDSQEVARASAVVSGAIGRP